MSEIVMTVTSEQKIENLLKLADYLYGLPDDYDKFDMSIYSSNTTDPLLNECGTVGCAVGHGPSAGIDCPKELMRRTVLTGGGRSQDNGVDFGQYRRLMFPYFGFRFFGAYWTKVDNTPKGAAQRIWYGLRKHCVDLSYLHESTPYQDCTKPELSEIHKSWFRAGDSALLSNGSVELV